MLVLFARHGEAVDSFDDDARWLTQNGRETISRVAKAISERVVLTHVFSSPLVRAVQTAEIFAHTLGFAGPNLVHRPLAIGDSEGILRVTKNVASDSVILLAGHEPRISAATGYAAGRSMPGFRTGTVAAVELPLEGSGTLSFVVQPQSGAIVEGKNFPK